MRFKRLGLLLEQKPIRVLGTILVLCFLIRVSYQVFYIKYYQFHDPYRNPRDATLVDGGNLIAENLIQGRGYRDPQALYPTARRGPVYPLSLALIYWVCGINNKVGLLFQSIYDTLTCLIIYHIALTLFRSQPTALLASLLWTMYLPGILYVAKFYSEPLFTMLLSLFILLILKSMTNSRPLYFTLTGGLLGLATLCRPVTQLFFIPAAFCCLVYFRPHTQKALSRSAILTLAFFLTLAPWAIRNYMVFDRFIPASTLLGYNLFIETVHVLEKDNYLDAVPNRREFIDFQRRIESKYGRLNEAEWSDIYFQEARGAIRAHPFRYLKQSLWRFMRLWFNMLYSRLGRLKEYSFSLINAPLMLLAALAFLLFRGKWRTLSLPLITLILYNTLVHMLTRAGIRFAVPVMPFVITFASFSITQLVHKVQVLRE